MTDKIYGSSLKVFHDLFAMDTFQVKKYEKPFLREILFIYKIKR